MDIWRGGGNVYEPLAVAGVRAAGMGAGVSARRPLWAVRHFVSAPTRLSRACDQHAGAGLTPFLCKILYDVTGQTPAIPCRAVSIGAALPGLDHGGAVLLWLKVRAGKSLGELCWRTSRGPRCGRHSASTGSGGLRVLVSGALAGMGGASLSFSWPLPFRAHEQRRGFMALAALIFGKWKPVPTALACLLLLCEAVQIRLQGVSMWAATDPGSIHPKSCITCNHLGPGRIRGSFTGAQRLWARPSAGRNCMWTYLGCCSLLGHRVGVWHVLFARFTA